MQVLWSRPALRDLEGLMDHIATHNPAAARHVADRIFEIAGSLSHLPERGRVGRVSGTREILVGPTPYILVYRVDRDRLQILAILHGARRWPDDFG